MFSICNCGPELGGGRGISLIELPPLGGDGDGGAAADTTCVAIAKAPPNSARAANAFCIEPPPNELDLSNRARFAGLIVKLHLRLLRACNPILAAFRDHESLELQRHWNPVPIAAHKRRTLFRCE